MKNHLLKFHANQRDFHKTVAEHHDVQEKIQREECMKAQRAGDLVQKSVAEARADYHASLCGLHKAQVEFHADCHGEISGWSNEGSDVPTHADAGDKLKLLDPASREAELRKAGADRWGVTSINPQPQHGGGRLVPRAGSPAAEETSATEMIDEMARRA